MTTNLQPRHRRLPPAYEYDHRSRIGQLEARWPPRPHTVAARHEANLRVGVTAANDCQPRPGPVGGIYGQGEGFPPFDGYRHLVTGLRCPPRKAVWKPCLDP